MQGFEEYQGSLASSNRKIQALNEKLQKSDAMHKVSLLLQAICVVVSELLAHALQ